MGFLDIFRDNKQKEVEDAIVSCDAGQLGWEELEKILKHKGIGEKEYETIRLEAHHKKANHGDAFSQWFYGMLVLHCKKDKSAAEHWYTLSGEQGNEDAISRLVDAYSEDINNYCPEMGFGANPEKELYWINRWVATGSIKGMIALAEQYRSGELVSEDLVAAKKWLEKAANTERKDSAEACIEIGTDIRIPNISKSSRIEYCKKAINLIADYWINESIPVKSIRPDISVFAYMLSKNSSDLKLLDKAACALGGLYFPNQQNEHSDAKLSAYYYSLSYIWGAETYGKEYTAKIIQETGYKTQEGEWERWCDAARDLRIIQA